MTEALQAFGEPAGELTTPPPLAEALAQLELAIAADSAARRPALKL